MHLRKSLAAIFSPTLRLAGPEPALVRRGGLLGEVHWIVPRAECNYRRMDFAALPARQRAGAAQIAARRHAAGPVRTHIAWRGPVAHAWTWPMQGEGREDDAGNCVPESLLRAPPASDGVRLLEQVHGFEGQCWRGGDLQASQWWAALPDADSWSRFARACGLGPESAAAAEPRSLPWSEPWADVRRGLPASPALIERWAWRAVAAVVLVALGWQVAAGLRWRLAESAVASRMEVLREKAGPLLAARERAERALDGIRSLQALQHRNHDYGLVARVIAPLPDDARLLEWQRDGDKLKVTVRASDTDPRHFVSAYGKDALLAGVVAVPGPSGTTSLAFDLAPPVSAKASP